MFVAKLCGIFRDTRKRDDLFIVLRPCSYSSTIILLFLHSVLQLRRRNIYSFTMREKKIHRVNNYFRAKRKERKEYVFTTSSPDFTRVFNPSPHLLNDPRISVYFPPPFFFTFFCLSFLYMYSRRPALCVSVAPSSCLYKSLREFFAAPNFLLLQFLTRENFWRAKKFAQTQFACRKKRGEREREEGKQN